MRGSTSSSSHRRSAKRVQPNIHTADKPIQKLGSASKTLNARLPMGLSSRADPSGIRPSYAGQQDQQTAPLPSTPALHGACPAGHSGWPHSWATTKVRSAAARNTAGRASLTALSIDSMAPPLPGAEQRLLFAGAEFPALSAGRAAS